MSNITTIEDLQEQREKVSQLVADCDDQRRRASSLVSRANTEYEAAMDNLLRAETLLMQIESMLRENDGE
jgi:hypothetical protein